MYESYPEKRYLIELTIKCDWCAKGIVKVDHLPEDDNPLIDTKCPLCDNDIIARLSHIDPKYVLNRIVKSI